MAVDGKERCCRTGGERMSQRRPGGDSAQRGPGEWSPRSAGLSRCSNKPLLRPPPVRQKREALCLNVCLDEVEYLLCVGGVEGEDAGAALAAPPRLEGEDPRLVPVPEPPYLQVSKGQGDGGGEPAEVVEGPDDVGVAGPGEDDLGLGDAEGAPALAAAVHGGDGEAAGVGARARHLEQVLGQGLAAVVGARARPPAHAPHQSFQHPAHKPLSSFKGKYVRHAAKEGSGSARVRAHHLHGSSVMRGGEWGTVERAAVDIQLTWSDSFFRDLRATIWKQVKVGCLKLTEGGIWRAFQNHPNDVAWKPPGTGSTQRAPRDRPMKC